MSVALAMDEELPLTTIPGSGDPQNKDTCHPVSGLCGKPAASCCNDKHHRNLAVCSIICGISCIGISALINSVKAEQEPNQAAAERFSQRAKKFGIISIATWVAVLVLTPVLMALVSYLITLKD